MLGKKFKERLGVEDFARRKLQIRVPSATSVYLSAIFPESAICFRDVGIYFQVVSWCKVVFTVSTFFSKYLCIVRD